MASNILHRLTVRKSLLSVLSTLFAGLSIISREAGFIDCFLPLPKKDGKADPSKAQEVGSKLAQALSEACASFGFGFKLLSTSLTDDSMVKVSFTNDLMTYQGQKVAGVSGFGSRGNNKTVRSTLGVATFPELAPVPQQATEQAPVPQQATEQAPVPQQATEQAPEAQQATEQAPVAVVVAPELVAEVPQLALTPSEMLAQEKAKRGKGKGKGK